MQRVAVLGGGVAGLTAADELSQRNFKVDVFERRDQLGGKARSFPSGSVDGLDGLPAEHGFRFIPGFYRHLPDTMRRIPYQGNSNVEANLVDASELALLRSGQQPTVIPASAWGFLRPWTLRLRLARHPFLRNFDLSPDDVLFLTERMVKLLGTCSERRLMELERTAWWDYCEADSRSAKAPEYATMMRAMTRSLVAAKADMMSARTGGDILAQLQLAADRFRGHPDRLLNGPTSDVWIEPWREKLARAGVCFHLNHEVSGFRLDGQQLAAVSVKDKEEGKDKELTDYEWYVCALPVEVMTELVDDNLKKAAPSLANLRNLEVQWMNGFMIYLRRDFEMVRGHSIYINSPWALTSVSQRQFWPGHLGWTEPGAVEGILSVDISDWCTPGSYVKKPAVECTPEEIRQEVLGEIRAYGRGTDWESALDAGNIAGCFVDPDIILPNPGGAHVNLEPLFVNTKGSWASRPQSHTEILNLVVAADYVRTYTDLATMEGANESARRAVNCILRKAQPGARPCQIWPLHEPRIFARRRRSDKRLFKKVDAEVFKQGREMLRALHATRRHWAPPRGR